MMRTQASLIQKQDGKDTTENPENLPQPQRFMQEKDGEEEDADRIEPVNGRSEAGIDMGEAFQ